jgi:hypothetical protein
MVSGWGGQAVDSDWMMLLEARTPCCSIASDTLSASHLGAEWGGGEKVITEVTSDKSPCLCKTDTLLISVRALGRGWAPGGDPTPLK